MNQNEIIERLIEEGFNIKKIKEESLRGYGDVNNPNRIKIYQKLLSAKEIQLSEIPETEEDLQHYSNEVKNDLKQIDKDMGRTYGKILKEEEAIKQRKRLSHILKSFVIRNQELRYYQGFHDIIGYLVLFSNNDELLLGITEQLAKTRFRQLLTSFDSATENGEKALEKVKILDHELGQILDDAECNSVFTFPWYTTWFLHNLKSIDVGSRLMDFFIAADSDDLLRFIVAMIISKRNDVFALEEKDFGSIHALFTDAPMSFTINDIQQLINMTVYLRNNNSNLNTLLKITSNPYEKLIQKNTTLYVCIAIGVAFLSLLIMSLHQK